MVTVNDIHPSLYSVLVLRVPHYAAPRVDNGNCMIIAHPEMDNAKVQRPTKATWNTPQF